MKTHQLVKPCVIDFGCGTGILAIAAAKLKAKSVLAIDNDPQAVIASHENVKKNHCEDIIKPFIQWTKIIHHAL